MQKVEKNKLSVFGFFALTATMVWTVYEYPTFATAKLNLLFFVVAGGFLWFMPVALIAAEMASIKGFEEGGIFGWVSQSLGDKYGLAAIFFEWFQATIAFITMCYFIIGASLDILHLAALNNNSWVKFIGVCLIFWSATLIQFKGLKKTVGLAKFGMVFGIVIPTLLFACLSLLYLFCGGPIQIKISMETFIPDFRKVSTLVVAVSFVLAFGGIEASASDIRLLPKPKRDYPIVILLLALVTIIIDAIGGLSIAAVIPTKNLSLTTGVIQAFRYLIGRFMHHGEWLVDISYLYDYWCFGAD